MGTVGDLLFKVCNEKQAGIAKVHLINLLGVIFPPSRKSWVQKICKYIFLIIRKPIVVLFLYLIIVRNI